MLLLFKHSVHVIICERERKNVQGVVVGVLNTVIPYNHSFQEQDEGEVISKTRQSMNENLKSLYHETKKKSHLKIRRF